MMGCWKTEPNERSTFPYLDISLSGYLEETVRSRFLNMDVLYVKLNEKMMIAAAATATRDEWGCIQAAFSAL